MLTEKPQSPLFDSSCLCFIFNLALIFKVFKKRIKVELKSEPSEMNLHFLRYL